MQAFRRANHVRDFIRAHDEVFGIKCIYIYIQTWIKEQKNWKPLDHENSSSFDRNKSCVVGSISIKYARWLAGAEIVCGKTENFNYS